MLVADIVRRAIEVDVNPSAAFETVSFREGRIVAPGMTSSRQRTRSGRRAACDGRWRDLPLTERRQLRREQGKSQRHQDERKPVSVRSHSGVSSAGRCGTKQKIELKNRDLFAIRKS